MTNQFRYEYDCMGNTLSCIGDLEWDKDKKQWKATIIPQIKPEIRYEAWDDDGSIASLMCIAKWTGQILQHDDPTPQSEIEALAASLWDEGYRRIDSDRPGIVRWHTSINSDQHPERTIPMEVWWFMRGCHFGIGDYNSTGRDEPKHA